MLGRPPKCPHGKDTKRYKSGTCVACAKISNTKHRKNNREAYRRSSKAWVDRNKERVRKANLLWNAENRDKMNFYTNMYRASKLKATPKWINEELVRDMYLEAQYQQMEVDHIVPLRGKMVCGLHWEGNLQLLSREENASKSNKVM